MRSESGALKLDVAVPGAALEEAAQAAQVGVAGAMVQANVQVTQAEGLRQLCTVLHVSLPGMAHALAARLVDMAYRRCPYTRSWHGHMHMTIEVNHILLKAA
ncbi:MAG: hypothetical protein K2Q01_03740 [Rickettsiales bacterium]|nr:hypothetical protein [Rickettsiales bacterium]